jgi:FtsP/CotA-like multicopper oxidase with cupredoxin domain
MRRRDLLKLTATSLVAGTVSGEETVGPFSEPTARFSSARQHELPNWAFTDDLKIPLVPRPTAVGSFADIDGKPVFGPGDDVPIGKCFHGVAREWAETPKHWEEYGCDATLTGAEAWRDKQEHFGAVDSFDKVLNGDAQAPLRERVANWGGFPIKCYKIPITETLEQLGSSRLKTRMYSFSGMVPGPTLPLRLGQPIVVRFENHLEAEVSVHLHGGHSPPHSDGFPTFYVLQGKARDYFYPNIVPLFCQMKEDGTPGPLQLDLGESQSTMWYHDHAMDATGFNVSKGLAAFATCFGEEELKLIHDRVLPGLGPASCRDPERDKVESDPAKVKELEDPSHPGFYRYGKEPYHNPYDVPLVLQDKVIDDATGQIAYDNTGHNGYLGDTFLVNGVPWPQFEVRNRKYRFRVLNGANARVYRLRLLSADDFWAAKQSGIAGRDEEVAAASQANSSKYDAAAKPFLRIGKDSWLWSHPVEITSAVLTMANRADLVVDFGKLTEGLTPGETREFFLVNTMPQADGRGPKQKLDDAGDPRVLPLPFDTTPIATVDDDGEQQIPDVRLAELNRPIGLMKFVVRYAPPGSQPDDPPDDQEATLKPVVRYANRQPIGGTPLIKTHRIIEDHEVSIVREFIFERGKGAWQVNGRFYDPNVANATPVIGTAEEWVLRNGGGGWWHPIHIHLESHQLISYEKDFDADEVVDRQDPPARPRLENLIPVLDAINPVEVKGLHDTQVLGPNTVARIRMRFRTWNGPFVFHCHNLEHEDMRMMLNFELIPRPSSASPTGDVTMVANIAPAARTHGRDVTLGRAVGELPWEYPPVPRSRVNDASENVIPPRPKIE